MTLLDAALAFREAGCSVVPASTTGSKAPASFWKNYMSEAADDTQLFDWFDGTAYDGLGLVCGAVSGGLEMLEVEGRAAHLAGDLGKMLADIGFADLWARLCSGYFESSPSGGLHWLYRVQGAPARGNTKLARRPGEVSGTVDVLIETRGEGGFVVTAPSGGRTHPSGKPWLLLAGGPATIPTISGDERDALYAIASTFDSMPVVDAPAPRALKAVGTAEPGARPGDDFNARADWLDIIGPHGWVRGRSFGGSCYGWVRPGKKLVEGISATTGRNDGDNLYVFSSSTEFETEKAYSKFAAYALLHHGNDYSAAAKELARQGYGKQPEQPRSLAMNAPASTSTSADPFGTGLAPVSRPAAATPGALALVVAPAPEPDIEPVAQLDAAQVTLTDEGNARLLVARHGAGFRYAPARGKWLRWDGRRWAWCEDDSEAVEAARETVHAIEPDDVHERRHKTKSLSRGALDAMVALARRDGRVRIRTEVLDADPYSLCTPGGVVQLRTGEVVAATPEQLNTKLTGVAPDFKAVPTRWLAFLAATFEGDQAVIDFVQRLAGYSATGLATHHVLPFLYGAGGNGKGVFLEVLLRLLGDYATSAPAGFLMAGKEEHDTQIARLDGMRMVVCSEVNQRDKFDEAKVKLLTGGDPLTARFMRQDFFTFMPTHKLWLMGNHQPRVDAGGESFWRRLRLLPFTRVVPKAERIEGLALQMVETEGPAILAWLLAGARQVLADGLAEPASVMAATELYAAEEDALARFVADRCHVGGGPLVRVNTADMRQAYEVWSRQEGEKPISPQLFGRELKARWGVDTTKSNGARFYTGATLLAPDEAPEEWWQK